MKRIVLLLIIITSSCSNKINKKDLQGNWIWNYQENNKSNWDEIIIKNDSVTLTDFFFNSKKGIYKLKKDSIIISLKDETIKRKIFLHNSSLILNSNNFQKTENFYKEKYDEIELINIRSEIKKNASEIDEYQGNFILLKYNDSVKIKLNNQFVEFPEYIYSLGLHNERWGHVIFLGKNFSLRELKNVYLELTYYNLLSIKFITKMSFQNNYYDFHHAKIEVWKEDLEQFIEKNKLEKTIMPKIPGLNSKQEYIKTNNPKLINIKSKKDLVKLENTKINTTYLISININLSTTDFLLLNQKINKLKRNGNFKIRTEIIDF
ncbi:hypothetical protein [Polaribacter sp. Asnod6-C07]|uniref:hypothetical protein n=1 Tax=Polaribacter sp. Asnod6-C07 TaxID=3160582 RepID=UPI00386AAD03